jgi:hypothetical protein
MKSKKIVIRANVIEDTGRCTLHYLQQSTGPNGIKLFTTIIDKRS